MSSGPLAPNEVLHNEPPSVFLQSSEFVQGWAQIYFDDAKLERIHFIPLAQSICVVQPIQVWALRHWGTVNDCALLGRGIST